MSTVAQPYSRSGAAPDDRDPVTGAIAEALRSLVRSLRAHALYKHDNPAYLRSLEQTRVAFGMLWANTRELLVAVSETELRHGEVVVHTDGERGGGDALAWMLYKDGVRELTLLPGFQEGELAQFLETLHQVRRAMPDDDDLVTLLWEKDLQNLRFRSVHADEGRPYAAPEDPTGTNIGSAVQAAAASTSNIVRMEDLEGTLYFLDEHEITYLRGELDSEYTADVRTSLSNALLDTFEAQRSSRVREEVCGALDALLLQLLVAGAFASVASLLREARVTAGRARDITDAHRERLLGLGRQLSEPGVLEQLIQALDGGSAATIAEGERLLEELEVSALATLLRQIEEVERIPVREAMERAVSRIASAHTNELIKLVAHQDTVVSIGAMRRAGSTRMAGAVPALAQRLTASSEELRQAAAEALSAIGSAGALQSLERVLDDSARGVRLAACRAFSAHGYRAALPRLEALVRGKETRAADLTERMAIFEAYGSLCGAQGVEVLDSLLNGRGFLGRRPDAEVRACAAVALGRINVAEARTALQAAAGDKEVVVRTAVQRALRGAAA
ncbi:MAG TPA: HEAT repeat domain-containing protein [Gemmatimonadales bacterium]|nr:HEAT repeat domain-containing protein [Gemmatimonadales bacterium]